MSKRVDNTQTGEILNARHCLFPRALGWTENPTLLAGERGT